MNEMLASAPKVFASHLNSVFSSDAGLFLTSPLSHWSIKNSVHRFLDEDDTRIRQGHAQHNMAVLRRLAFNLLRRGNSAQIGISAKRKRAGWKTDYLLKNSLPTICVRPAPTPKIVHNPHPSCTLLPTPQNNVQQFIRTVPSKTLHPHNRTGVKNVCTTYPHFLDSSRAPRPIRHDRLCPRRHRRRPIRRHGRRRNGRAGRRRLPR